MSGLTSDRPKGQHRIDADISREIVRIHAHYYGRGPTSAKTYVSDDAVFAVLGGIFTPSERMLIEAGRFAEVRANRIVFLDTVEPLMCEAVERICGRSVRSFLGQVSSDGLASEIFVLER
ncbi:MAG: DUF2294 family protein [Actinobacteria bacterium]|nr:DUF2294 family protein [Actinomycetota bacterium]